jgi:hypothetical protein
VDATGHFTVTNLSAQAGDVVAVLALYGDMSYPSELVTLDGSARTVDLPLKVYEQTTSTETIRIATLHIIATQTSGALDVTEIYVMSNTGDRAVANTTGSPTLRFNLPAAATGFRGMSETTGLYAETPEGFDYYEAVPPGSSTAQVVVAYQLPLSGDAIFDRAPTYPIDTVNLLVQAADLKPSSTQLLDQGPRDFQGQTYQLFTGGPFESGPMLAFRLSGAAAGVDVKLIAAGVLLVAGVAGIGYGLWRRRAEQKLQPAAVPATASARRLKPQAVKISPADRDRLIDEIAALDDAFDAGQIAQADYTRRREALKAKLLRQTGDD